MQPKPKSSLFLTQIDWLQPLSKPKFLQTDEIEPNCWFQLNVQPDPFVSCILLASMDEALKDTNWVNTMHEVEQLRLQ
jgi:hypothetical protein